MKTFNYIIAILALSMLIPAISFAEDMVRIPAEGASTTGYVGCSAEALPTPCAPESVKSETVKAFMMDVHEVTKGELETCINEGKCTDKYVIRNFNEFKVSDNWKDEPAGVPYDQAVEYCKAYGKRLPTTSEWLAAAMNGTVKKYTWGEDYEETSAAAFQLNRATGEAVMSYPKDFSQGVYDLSGSEVEWVESPLVGEYSEGYQCVDARTRTCMGSLNYPLYQELACISLHDYRGFRCVKSVKQLRLTYCLFNILKIQNIILNLFFVRSLIKYFLFQ